MKRLIKIQQSLKSPKGRRNDFGKFNYRSASDILEAVKPLLQEEGLAIVLDDEVESVGSELVLTATCTLYEEKDCKVIVSTHACAIISNHTGMSKDQSTGAASSYARKYALCGMFAIDDSANDPDSFEGDKAEKKDTTATPVVTKSGKETVEFTFAEKAEKLRQCKTKDEANALFTLYGLDMNDKEVAELVKELKQKFSK